LRLCRPIPVVAEKVDSLLIEIAICGAAFRKIFVSFVLLFSLVEAKESLRLFLFEEPESLLYPDLFQHFMILFLDEA